MNLSGADCSQASSRVTYFYISKKNFRSIALDVKTVKSFESKLDQKPQLYWRLAIPGVDRVPGR